MITPGSKVLVTGCNGFAAIWVVRTLLEEGFAVRGTVRSASKGEYLLEMFKSYGSKFELVVIPNIEIDGAFDEAVKGIDAIEHMASPYHWNADDPDEIIQPAVRGTTGILQSTLNHGSNVQRIMITSSTAAAVRSTEKPLIFTENDWNDEAIQTVQEQGRKASNIFKYFASKTLAERAAYEFYEKHKAAVNWDIVTIVPPGPFINETSSLSGANASIVAWHSAVLGGAMDAATLANDGNAWMDVRDVAKAHVRAIQREEPISSFFGWRSDLNGRVVAPFKWQDWGTFSRLSPAQRPRLALIFYCTVNAARALSPAPYPASAISVGTHLMMLLARSICWISTHRRLSGFSGCQRTN
ncbi:hypothetical protein A0H81_02122 [Grifola frondosa]|uniref:NAD-dependent epimerase/dehydratase domain-containing protein n=1 Tax=Grifola frondosa TaxID=5627 RepID=A0A1C7MNV9_GRIFR|nr:hypothetical protein A0H81_02122 [Grifola frondosa]